MLFTLSIVSEPHVGCPEGQDVTLWLERIWAQSKARLAFAGAALAEQIVVNEVLK